MPKRRLYFDLETFCETPITYGSHRYAEDAEIIVVAYAFDDEPVQVWDCTAEPLMPADLYDAIHDQEMPVVIHNSSFDRTVVRHARGIDIALERIDDTLVRARTVSLPGSLGDLCDIYKLPVDKAKDKKGHELIRLFCCPRPKNGWMIKGKA